MSYTIVIERNPDWETDPVQRVAVYSGHNGDRIWWGELSREGVEALLAVGDRNSEVFVGDMEQSHRYPVWPRKLDVPDAWDDDGNHPDNVTEQYAA